MANTLGWMCGTCRGRTPQVQHLQPNPRPESSPSRAEGLAEPRVRIPGHRSTGAIQPHPCCGTRADTHHRNLGTPEGHSRVIPGKDRVMVAMIKQSQCLNLERSKENVATPAGRAATAQWLSQHHLMWNSAMSTILKPSTSH